jgi:hypothetical protein
MTGEKVRSKRPRRHRTATQEDLFYMSVRAMEELGYDGRGKYGVWGYLEMIVKKFPKYRGQVLEPTFIQQIYEAREVVLSRIADGTYDSLSHLLQKARPPRTSSARRGQSFQA